MVKENASINIAVTFRHTESTDALKAYAIEKLTHVIQKFSAYDTEASVVLSVQKLDHTAEVTLHSKVFDAKATATTHDLYAAIDKVSDNVETQLRKQKDRLTDHKHQSLPS